MSIDRQDVNAAADRICDELRQIAKSKIMAAYEVLTTTERQSLLDDVSTSNAAFGLARILGLAVSAAAIEDGFALQSIMPSVPKAKRMLSRRKFR